nr:LysR family transcriptional regulator [uncultured Halomonas sp.]
MRQLATLRTFLEAYRSGSLSAAARTLNLTQSAATNHIQTLETAIGHKLFERHARGVKATPSGHALAQSIARPLDQLEVAFSTAQIGSRQQLSGTVHLIAPAEFSEARLAPAIKQLVSVGIDIRLGLAGRSGIFKALADGSADLAITASTPEDDALDARTIATETLLLVGAPAFESSRHALQEAPLIAYDGQLPLICEYWEASFQSVRFQRPVVTAPDLRMVRVLVKAGIGISVLPDYLCGDDIEAGRLIRLHEPAHPIRNRLYLAWNRGALRHPRIVFVRDRLSEFFTQNSDAGND